MNWDRVNYKLSNINAFLGSAVGYNRDRQDGASVGDATMNFGMNLVNGAVRNEVAYDMRKYTGSNLGFLINGMAGYGDQESNARGMTGLMAASFMAPFMSPYGGGCGPFGGSMFGGYYGGGGMFGGGMFGGSGCGCGGGYMGMPYMGRSNFFMNNNFMC